MSSFEFTDGSRWGGGPLARRIADARPQKRAVITGTICHAKTVCLGPSTAYECVLDDGTGDLTLVFVGRHSVPGMVRGARCTVEGTARMVAGRFAIWNPMYRLEGASSR